MTNLDARERVVDVRRVVSTLAALQPDAKKLAAAGNDTGKWLLISVSQILDTLSPVVVKELEKGGVSVTPLVDIVYFANAGMVNELVKAMDRVPSINAALDKIEQALAESRTVR